VLALLHLIAGTVLGTGLAYGLCFLGFLIAAPGALVLSHLRREVEGNYRQGARDRTGLPVDVPRILRSRRVIGRQFLLFTCLLSVPIFVFTAMLFVLFPRVGLSFLWLNHARTERMVGFSERVDLGGVGRLRSDPTIVMRVEPPNLPLSPPPRIALYLRGAAFDRYDGRAWSRSSIGKEMPLDQAGGFVRIRRFPDASRDRVMRIDLEPIDPPVVFLPLDAVAVEVVTAPAGLDRTPPRLFTGPDGVLRYQSAEQRGLRYDVSIASTFEPTRFELDPFERTRYLALPELPPRIAELARSWAGDVDDPLAVARIVEAKLRKGYRYDLDSPSGAAKNPLDDFLFNSKRGHCEFYSTAMTVMLRTLDVPSRNVTGFVGGTFNRFSRSYVVRQGDAHSWVEVYLDETGWTRIDPLASLVICALIAFSSVRLLRESLHALMEGVPAGMSVEAIGGEMARVDGVLSVHDLHVWTLSGSRTALSAHVVVRSMSQWERLRVELQTRLHERFGIDHVTLQPESTTRPLVRH